jgi:dTDP-4-dehydrorhamnose reductase
MRILLTGKNGQVGFELQRALAPLGETHAIDIAEWNLADENAIRKLVQIFQPDLIVSPTAYTAVDKAESEPTLAAAINTRAIAVLGEEAAKLGAWVIHYSTDYVFDVSRQGHYTERDATNPQTIYGHTKRDGEQALQENGGKRLILRTSWVVGTHGANFAKTMLGLAAEHGSLKVIADQFGAPTSAALLADITAHLVRQCQREGKQKFPFCTYYLVAGGETNWCDYARFVVDEVSKANKAFKVGPETIHSITTADYTLPVPRIANSRLNTTHFRNTFGLALPEWEEGVHHILQ